MNIKETQQIKRCYGTAEFQKESSICCHCILNKLCEKVKPKKNRLGDRRFKDE